MRSSNPHAGYSMGEASVDQGRLVVPTMFKTIPFDYVFQFPLSGTPSNRVQDVVEISMQGVFVAVSTAYSFVLDERRTPDSFAPVLDQTTVLQGPVLVPDFSGFPVSPDAFHKVLIAGIPGADVAVLLLHPPGNIVELTLQPTPNPPSVLGTGTIGPNGTLSLDLNFAVESGSIICGWDRTNNLMGQLFEVGAPANGNGFETTPVIGPNPLSGKLPAVGDERVHVYGSPGESVELFLFDRTAAVGTPVEVNQTPVLDASTGRAEIRLVPSGTKLKAGDVLMLRGSRVTSVPFSMFTIPRPKPSTITLGALLAGLESVNADVSRGFRVNPNFIRFVDADLPLDQISQGILANSFEPGCGPDDVSFLYSIDVVSTGRELQNKPIHNIAGLGIANGDRPFRPFARPIAFEPRSVIRIQIEEISTLPGTLFIVLQGYKMLGTGRIPE
jgi:hypothetical protein